MTATDHSRTIALVLIFNVAVYLDPVVSHPIQKLKDFEFDCSRIRGQEKFLSVIPQNATMQKLNQWSL